MKLEVALKKEAIWEKLQKAKWYECDDIEELFYDEYSYEEDCITLKVAEQLLEYMLKLEDMKKSLINDILKEYASGKSKLSEKGYLVDKFFTCELFYQHEFDFDQDYLDVLYNPETNSLVVNVNCGEEVADVKCSKRVRDIYYCLVNRYRYIDLAKRQYV